MFSCKNSFLAPRFNNNFFQSNQFHSYGTRNSPAYRLSYCRTSTKKFSPFFQGLKSDFFRGPREIEKSRHMMEKMLILIFRPEIPYSESKNVVYFFC